MKDVARKAGVSVPTASTVLNNARGNTVVGKATRQKIISAADLLNYRPNHQARVLKTGKSGAIGLLLDLPSGNEMNEAWLRGFALGAELRARETGNDFIIIGPTSKATVLDRGVMHASRGKVDALLAPGGKPSLADFDWRQLDVPLVLLGDDRHSTGLPHIAIDEIPAHKALIEHLAKLGHKNILWLGMENNSRDASPRRLASLHRCAKSAGLAMAERRLPAPEGLTTIADVIRHHRTHFAPILNSGLPRFTAMIAYNDLVAHGAMQALWNSGRRVPDEISVASFDDLFACLGHPAITSVAMPLAAAGARGADLALEIARSGKPLEKFRGKVETVPASLFIRESTGAM